MENKIYEQAKDLHVVATYIFDKGDEFAYTDVECTKKFTPSELEEVFIKGALIMPIYADTIFKPVLYSREGFVGYVNVAGQVTQLKAEADEAAE